MPEVDPRLVEYARRRDLARDITARQRALRQEEDEDGFLTRVAQIGGLIAGAYLLRRGALRAFQDDAVLSAVHGLGQTAKKIGQPAANWTRGLLEYYSGTRLGKPQDVFGRFELLERFSQAQTLQKQIEAQAGSRIVSGNVAHQAEIIGMVRKGLRHHGFEDLAAGAERYRPMTVGDVLDSPNLQKAIGQQNWQVLQEGWKGGQGALTRAMPLERGRIGGAFVRNVRGQQPGFIDTRWLSPKRITRGAYNILANVQVPFFGFRPVDLIANIARPFSEGEFAGMVAPNATVGIDRLTGRAIRTSKGINVFYGGTLYSRRNAESGWRVVGENLRLFKRSGVGDSRLYRYGAASELAPELTQAVERQSATWWQKFQYRLGIGPAYRTQDWAPKTAFLDPMRRRDAVVRGRARIEPFEYVSRESTLPWRQKLQASLGVHPSQQGKPAGFDVMREAIQQDPAVKLGWWERIKTYWGKSQRAAVARPGGGRLSDRLVTSKKQPQGFMQATLGRKNLTGRRAIVGGEEPRMASQFGELIDPPTTPIGHYVGAQRGLVGQIESAVDVVNYMTVRLNDLIGWTTGVGFRPSLGKGIAGGLGATALNLGKIYGMAWGAQAALGYLNYADYLFEATVGHALPQGWTSPKKVGIQLYQEAQQIRSHLRDALQIPEAATYLEGLMPGSVDSGFSWTLRTLGPVAGGIALQGKRGGLVGVALSLMIGGNDVQNTAEDTRKLFTGEKQVAVRKSRWWTLGRQPFEGGQIDYFAPHWSVRALSDYRFTPVQYGSKAEYYENVSRLPTFHNFFGLKMLFQDGGPVGGGDRYLAKKHATTRPYPNTPGIDYEKAVRDARLLASRGPYDAPFGAGQTLGYGTLGGLAPEPERTGTLGSAISGTADRVSELAGIYKFLLDDLPRGGDARMKMADYGTIGSTTREFYDMSLGGGFGMTELVRRFLLSQDAKQGLNPLPNQMAEWLPGMRSLFPEDRVQPNRFDYHIGDPYAKLPKGEMRLPGTGYEALHRLHSGTAGIYDPMDRFLILCITGETMLQSGWGTLKRADSIKIGDELVTHEGVTKPVTRVFHRKVDEEIYEVRSWFNTWETLRITGEHPILVERDGLEWIKAKDLREDDILAFPIPRSTDFRHLHHLDGQQVLYVPGVLTRQYSLLEASGEIRVKHEIRGAQSSIPVFLPLDCDFAFVAGLYAAEGCISRSGHTGEARNITFTFHIDERHLAQRVTSFFAKHGQKTVESEKPETKSRRVDVNSTCWADLFLGLFGEKDEKVLPAWFVNLGEDFVRTVVLAYVEGDGWVGKTGRYLTVRTSSVSLQLTTQIRNFLLYLGIPSTLRADPASRRIGKGLGKTAKDSFILNVTGRHAESISPTIKLARVSYQRPVNSRVGGGRFVDGYFLFKVRSIRKVHYRGTVFNFEVSGDHSYVTVGFCTHNSDVAPTSQAFKHYKTIVESWQASGVLDSYWSDRFVQAKEQVKQKMERYQFAHRRFTGLITDPDPEGTRKRYSAPEKVVGAAWEVFTHDVVPRVGDAVPILGPILFEKGLQQLSPIEHYLRYQVQGEEFADWRHPYKAFVRHKWNTMTAHDPFTAGAGGAVSLGLLFGSNPIGMALGATVGAGLFAGGSMARHLGGDLVPDFRERERELAEWFDTFGYLKNRMLETRAQAVGDPLLAQHFEEQKRRTVASLDYGQSDWWFTQKAMKAMDTHHRSYFLHFLEMPSGSQDALLPYLPQNLRPALLKASSRLGESPFAEYRKYTQRGSDERAAQFMAQAGGMPRHDWAGWHPDVPMDAVKIKFVDSHVNSVSADIHKFDLYAEHRYRANAWGNIPIPVGSLEDVHDGSEVHADLRQQFMDAGFTNVQFRYGMGPGHEVRWNLLDRKIDAVKSFLGDLLR